MTDSDSPAPAGDGHDVCESDLSLVDDENTGMKLGFFNGLRGYALKARANCQEEARGCEMEGRY